jgi:hypothetical protein
MEDIKKRHLNDGEAWQGELEKRNTMEDMKRDTLLKLSTKVS